MREVDQEYEPEKDEDSCTNHGNVVSPDHEERIGDEEGYGNEDQPKEYFGTPPASYSVSIVKANN